MTGLRIENPDPTLPDFLGQLGWGSRSPKGAPLDGSNCNCASFGMAADVQTGGQVRPNPAAVRAAQSDQIEGTDLRDGNEALRELGVPELELVDGPWEYVRDAVEAGRGAVVQLIIAPVYELGPGFWGSETFRKGHSIFLPPRGRHGGGDVPTEYDFYDPLYDGRRAGIPKGPRRIPGRRIHEGAGLLNRGPGTVLAGLTRDVVQEIPTVPPARKPQVVERFRDIEGAAPILGGGLERRSDWVIEMPIDVPLALGPTGDAALTVVTRVSPRPDGRPYRVLEYFGNWQGMNAVEVMTRRLLDDGASRPVILYAPGNAGVKRRKET